MKYKDVYNKVAKQENISPSLVEEIYKKYWKKVRELIESFDLKSDNIDWSNKYSFNLPYLGKLYITKDLIAFRKQRYAEDKKDKTSL